MAEPTEVFVPAVAALPVVEARLAAGWSVLAVAGFRVKRNDSAPDPALVLDLGPEGTTEIEMVASVLSTWPVSADRFVEVRFVPRG